MSEPCACARSEHDPRFVVVTGGPGAGKTALLGVATRKFCRHVVALPEAASILWTGGFPRRSSVSARCAAQRAIARVERELEAIAAEERGACVVLCDRGTLDGLAYWPDTEARFFEGLATSREAELSRYAAVIHLRPPRDGHYPQGDPVRVETAADAQVIDRRIEEAWRGHPRRVFIDSDDDFVAKLALALEAIRAELPRCCAPPAP